MGDFNFREMVSAFIVLFAVIDILGSVPIIIDIRDKGGRISAWQAAPVSFGILIAFLLYCWSHCRCCCQSNRTFSSRIR